MTTISIQKTDQIPTGRYARMAYLHLEESFQAELAGLMEDNTIAAYLSKIQKETVDMVRKRIRKLQTKFIEENKNSTYLEKANHYEHARMTAEEEILPEMIMTVIPNLST